MKKTRIFAAILSLSIGMTSFSAAPMAVTAEDATPQTASAETEKTIPYGDIAFNTGTYRVEMYTGEEPDLSDAVLWLKTYTTPDYSTPTIHNCEFTIGSGLYSDMYTIDTSGIDNTKAGDYYAIVKPKAEAVGTFTTKGNKSVYGKPLPDGDYQLRMKGNESKIPVKVYDKDIAKETPLYLHFYTEAIESYPTGGVMVNLVGALASKVTYEIADETIVKVDEKYSSNRCLSLKPLKVGETTVKVTTSDGRSITEKIRILPVPQPVTSLPDTQYQTTTTSVAGQTTASTTTTAFATVDKWWYALETTTTTTAVWTTQNAAATTTTSTTLLSNVKGDANCDGILNLADAVLIMQSIANPDKYKLTEAGKKNADMDGNGITNNDALAIQKKLLGLTDTPMQSTEDYPCAIMLDDVLYLQTNEAYTKDIPEALIKTPASAVKSGLPQKNGESNFGSLRYAVLEDGTVVVELKHSDSAWKIFKSK